MPTFAANGIDICLAHHRAISEVAIFPGFLHELYLPDGGSHPLGDFPHEPYLSPLLFRIIKEGLKLPVPGWDEGDMVIVGEGLRDAYLYLGAKTLPDGRREVLVAGLDVLSDTPEGHSLLANLLSWLSKAER